MGGQSAMLAGTRVLDLSQFLPGPYATAMLAALGAEVIKVEPPGGDPMAMLLCPPGRDRSPLYDAVNCGKTVVRIDLKSAPGKALLETLVQDADVLLDGFRPGVLERLGLGYETARERRPSLIWCALSGYGSDGPYRERAGHDINYCAVAGLLSRTDADPQIPFPLLADHSGATQAVTAILAALVRQRTRDEGAFLDIALYESLYNWQYIDDLPGLRQLVAGGAANYNLYRSADGTWFSLGAIEPHFWERFCRALGEPGWIERIHEPLPQAELIDSVRASFAALDSVEILSRFADVDCCLEPLPVPGRVHDHPQARARDQHEASAPAFPGRIDGAVLRSATPVRILETGETPCWQHREG